MSIRLPAVSRLHRTVFGRNSLARSPWILALLLFAPLGLGPLSWTQLEAQSSQQPTAHGESLRPVVSGSRGVVASNHPRASAAGIEVLMQGGNAFDAAIATGAALGVVEPFMSGLGGVGWMIFYHAQSGEVRVLNFSGRSPADLRASFYEDAIDARGPLSMLVPGSAAAWQALVDEGYATLPPAALLEPAIRLAEGGYPITAFGLSNHASSEALFRNWDGVAASTWWGESAAVPTLGQMIRNENLALSYRQLAQGGFGSFYRGAIPREISAFVQKHGGVLSEEDFAGYRVTWEAPIRTSYRGYEILSTAPNSSGGLAVLQTLNILEGFDVAGMGVNSPAYIHTMTEAIKLASADRARWAGDPERMEEGIPLDRLLSKEYAEELRRGIDPSTAVAMLGTGVSQVGTTHYTVADGEGNIISVTTTMGSGFGSGMVGGETGITLNNGVSWFELDPESPAFVEGGKRTRWNMAPTLIVRDGLPFVALGTPGGTTIWQTIPQLITKLIDFEMDVQNAIESPRFRWELGSTVLRPEGRIPEATLERLRQLGHDVQPLVDWTSGVGGMNAIMVDRRSGALLGGADPRRDGYVIGW